MKYKICSNSKCNKKLPATIEYFYKKKNGKFGLCSECKECMRSYYRNNKEKRKLYNKQYYIDNREELMVKSNEYYKSNKDKRSKYFKEYAKTKKGKEVYSRKIIKYKKQNRLSLSISNSIRDSLNGNKSGRHWEDLVGYTLKDLKTHLEKLFEEEISWNNYGIRGWHIDHIKPISAFCKEKLKDSNSKEFKECWSLNNLQPLWWYDNLKKGNKYEL